MQHKVRKLLIEDKSFHNFVNDRILQLAVEREFEIIGEALVRLEQIDPSVLAVKIPEHRKIVGFRNLLAHGYDVIDDEALWDFAKNLVPELLDKVTQY